MLESFAIAQHLGSARNNVRMFIACSYRRDLSGMRDFDAFFPALFLGLCLVALVVMTFKGLLA